MVKTYRAAGGGRATRQDGGVVHSVLVSAGLTEVAAAEGDLVRESGGGGGRVGQHADVGHAVAVADADVERGPVASVAAGAPLASVLDANARRVHVVLR